MLIAVAIASFGLFLILPPPQAAAGCAAVCLIVAYVRYAIHRSVRFPPLLGVESMAGRHAVVVAALRPVGTVRFQGELWRAEAARDVAAGTRVTIVRVERQPEGMTVVVE